MKSVSTLKKQSEFVRTYKKGTPNVSNVLVTYVLKNYKKGIRVGITTSKKIGNAVRRNRARRIIREAFRQLAPKLSGNFDFVFVARGKTPFLKTQDVKRKMAEALRQAGVLDNLDKKIYEKNTNLPNKILSKKHIGTKTEKM